MGTTLRRIDIIYEGINTLIIGIIVLKRNFHIDAVFHPFKIHDLIIQKFFASVQVCNKFLDTTFIVKCLFLLLIIPVIF